ncbi:hypothetical protein CCH79_00015871, partial [Gambusia affinis]
VTENIISKQTFIEARTMPRSFNNSKFMSSVAQRPSAHLTLRDTSSQGFSPYPIPTAGLHQSCRHVVRSWANQSFGAHLHNMTLTNGRLRVPQDGRYYLYSQVYFRYPSPAASDGDQRSVSHQLVQCVYKKTSYPSPIQCPLYDSRLTGKREREGGRHAANVTRSGNRIRDVRVEDSRPPNVGRAIHYATTASPV